MNKIVFRATFFLVAILMLFSSAQTAFGSVYIHANGGSYWVQSGTTWASTSNDGYCVFGRGPCGSNLWYLQWSWAHNGCGYDALAQWNMASVVGYDGDTYAWIDSSSGSMYGADYTISYNYASTYAPTVDQSPYFEQWATVALNKYRTAAVFLSDGWGSAYICNGVSNVKTEWDELKLEI